MIFCNIRTDFNFIFGQFSVARKLILNGGAIRPIGLLFLYCFYYYKQHNYQNCIERASYVKLHFHNCYHNVSMLYCFP